MGASPNDGSSNIIRRGFAISPLAIANICCSPPERSPPYWFSRSFNRGNMAKTLSKSLFTPAASLRSSAPMRRLSITESLAKICRPSGTSTSPFFTSSYGLGEISLPQYSMLPLIRFITEAIHFNMVLLPAPFAPRTATASPSSTCIVTPCRAVIPPYPAVSSFTSNSLNSRHLPDMP